MRSPVRFWLVAPKKIQVERLGFFYSSHRLGMASRICVYGIAFMRIASPKEYPLWLDSIHYRGSDSIRLLCNRFHSVLDGFLSKPQAWYASRICAYGIAFKRMASPKVYIITISCILFLNDTQFLKLVIYKRLAQYSFIKKGLQCTIFGTLVFLLFRNISV